MSIIVYTENWAGKFRKSTFEAICYARKIADMSNKEVKAISVGEIDDDELKKTIKLRSKYYSVLPKNQKE